MPPEQDPHASSPDREIERLVQELSRVIRGADTERQEELTDLAHELFQRDVLPVEDPTTASTQQWVQRPMNPLAAGLGLAIVGAGFSLVLLPVGLLLIGCGVIAILWGFAMSWFKR